VLHRRKDVALPRSSYSCMPGDDAVADDDRAIRLIAFCHRLVAERSRPGEECSLGLFGRLHDWGQRRCGLGGSRRRTNDLAKGGNDKGGEKKTPVRVGSSHIRTSRAGRLFLVRT
jgi:hypothetical protein